MRTAADDVLLQRVTLRGEAAEIDAARAPLLTALEQTSWPSTVQGEFLFLRRINANGNPREIAARAASQARRLADNAVDGWSSAAPDAMAVRFPSHASLIACLLRDLLQGNAQKRWYWRRWRKVLQLPTADTIVTLLQESPLELPAVVAQLRTTPVWKPFWQQLGEKGGKTLLVMAAQTTGWNNILQRALNDNSENAKTDVESVATFTSQIVSLFDLAFLNCSRNDARPLLAALLTIWQQAPTLLTQERGALHLRHLALAIAGASADTTELQRRQSPVGMKRDLGERHQDAKNLSIDDQNQIPVPLPFAKGVMEFNVEGKYPPQTEPSTSPPLQEGTRNAGIKIDGRFRSPATTDATNATAKSSGSAPFQTSSSDQQWSQTETPASAEPFEHNFITQQGGLFYLLNFLNLPVVREQLPTNLLGAGWRWLYDLATAMRCTPEGAVLEFMAYECGMKNGAELLQQSPVVPIEELLRLGAGRYGDEAWKGDTWRIPARLIATTSHLDLHFRLNDANLAVRRVGLDINPGWLPWLGRVVTFHYGSGMEPLV